MTSATDRITPDRPGPHESGDSAEQTVRACIRRIKEREPEVRAFVHFDPEGALAQARALDELAPERRGPLHGMPVAIKEVFDVKGLKCAWGTPVHADRVPTCDAWVVAALRKAGAVIMGTTVSTEYALAKTGPTRNPWDSSRTPGASSSGPAAAVGAGMVPVALGSQTIGSIIRPAAYCGIFGFKPSWRTIDDTGAMPLSETLDHVGILASSMKDLRRTYSVLRSRPGASSEGNYHEARPKNIKVLTDIDDDEFSPVALAAIDRVAELFKSQGCEVTKVTLDAEISDIDGILRTILCRDMARHHGDDRDRAGDQMSERVRTMIDRGRGTSEEEYNDAHKRAIALSVSIHKMIGPEDLILTGSTCNVAPPHMEGTGSRAPQMLWTLVGMPAITVPSDMADGLPIGVQLVGGFGNDDAVLAAAENLSKELL